jgi:nicotinate-nucleotide pyrophosphorylase (carboxylating)
MTLSPILIEKIVRAALEEDLGPSMRDITAELTIPASANARAVIIAREEGVLAGLIPALSTFTILDPDFDITLHAADGDELDADQAIAVIEGPARELMMAERTALNIIGHLSGIATQAAKYVEAIKGTGATITDTRKTLPGLRALQKYAVTQGGGSNHRFGLYDAIMIKDNHIAIAGGIGEALKNVSLLASHTTKIEIEVDTLDQLEEVLAQGSADIVLFDNMDIKTLRKAVDMAKGKIITEASGGVTLETIRAIAETGVDYISVGALTHSVKNLDIGLDMDA